MRTPSLITLAILILAGMMPLSLQADYLKNTDFKEGSQCWRGDGQAVFLRPDGTEGAEGDKGVIPVLKITLSRSQPRCVYQEFPTKDAPGKLHIRVEAFASADFKRSSRSSAYQMDDYMPITDFMIRSMPDYDDKTSDLKPGEWVTVDSKWEALTPADNRAVYFFVPPGEGKVYIKNPSVTP
jgi:hypothetical protein